MAGQERGLGFTGSLHNISACKRKDMDTIIIRSKGGPSKRMIKSHPSFWADKKEEQGIWCISTASNKGPNFLKQKEIASVETKKVIFD